MQPADSRQHLQQLATSQPESYLIESLHISRWAERELLSRRATLLHLSFSGDT
jgi:hypothetical protein